MDSSWSNTVQEVHNSHWCMELWNFALGNHVIWRTTLLGLAKFWSTYKLIFAQYFEPRSMTDVKSQWWSKFIIMLAPPSLAFHWNLFFLFKNCFLTKISLCKKPSGHTNYHQLLNEYTWYNFLAFYQILIVKTNQWQCNKHRPLFYMDLYFKCSRKC